MALGKRFAFLPTMFAVYITKAGYQYTKSIIHVNKYYCNIDLI